MIRKTGRLALLVLCLLLISTIALAEGKTYIEFIFDASFSMDQRVDGRRTRMDVAKEVMEVLLEGLEDRPDLEIALRVYGSKLTDVVGCRDSILFQAFGPVGEVRPSILKTIKRLKPAGMTPIGYSLELAAQDFPQEGNNRNVIVLITDGEESCNADPCAISKKLQEEGVILRPYVVGFALSALEEASVRCIGNYYPAHDRESLLTALQSIMVEVVSPPSLVVEAWADGINVTGDTKIELFGASGAPVSIGKVEKDPHFVKLTVDEDSYTVQGTLMVGPEELTVRKTNVFVEKGQTTKVVLDFGSLKGGVFLRAFAGEQEVSDQVEIRVEQDGRPVRAAWSGFPPETILAAGAYDFVVTLPVKGREPLVKRATGWVSPRQNTEVWVDFGELPAFLEVRAIYQDRDITSQCQLEIYREGRSQETLPRGKDLFRYETRPGVLDIKANYQGVVKGAPGVALEGGQTTQVTIDFGDVLGLLRIRVLAGDEDVTREAEVELSGAQFRPSLRGNWLEVLMPPGVYGLSGSYRGYPSRLAEVEVKAGGTAEVTLTIELPGKIVLAPSAGGRTLSPDRVSARVVREDRVVKEFTVSLGRLEATASPGLYTVECTYMSDPEQTLVIEGVAVKGGKTVEVPVVFQNPGRIQVQLFVDGKKTDEAEIMLCQDKKPIRPFRQVQGERGLFEIGVLEGTYELQVIPRIPGFKERLIEGIGVKEGQLIERQVRLEPSKLRVKLLSDGVPFETEGRLMVYSIDPDGWEDEEYVCDLEMIERGVYESKLKEGTYEIALVYLGAGIKDRRVPVEIVAGETLEKVIDVGGMGRLRIRLLSGDDPLRTDDGRLMVYTEDEDYVCDLEEVSPGNYEAKLPEGLYHVLGYNLAPGVREAWYRDLEVFSGETTSKTVRLGGMGRLRIRLLSGDKPLRTDDGRLMVYKEDGDYVCDLEEVSPGNYEAELPEGLYHVLGYNLAPGVRETWYRDIEVFAGETTSKTVRIGGMGRLRIRLLSGDEPVSTDGWFVVFKEDGEYAGELKKVSTGNYEAELPEGLYHVQGINLAPGVWEEWYRDIEVSAGETTSKTVKIGGMGRLRIRLLSGDEPLSTNGGFAVFKEDGEYACDLKEVSPGTYEAELPEGLYHVQGIHLAPGEREVWCRDIEVIAGETTSKTVRLGGMGRLRIRLLSGGKPLSTDGWFAVFKEGGYYVCDLEEVSPGNYEAELLEGLYHVQGINVAPRVQEAWYQDIEVFAGETTSKTVRIED